MTQLGESYDTIQLGKRLRNHRVRKTLRQNQKVHAVRITYDYLKSLKINKTIISLIIVIIMFMTIILL